MLTPHLEIALFRRHFPAYRFFGLIGYFAGCGLGIALTLLRGLNPGVLLLLCGISAATFFALAWMVKIVKGQEIIVYYHHEIAILSTCTLTLFALKEPVLPYLEIVLLGIGTLLCFGRWGCFSVGCCHGKPCDCRLGVIYSRAHADAGFPSYYVGLKMFPMPLVESVWVFFTVLVSAGLVVEGYFAGTALVFYTVVYGTARFVFEFWRGDPERPYALGFSEAQWTTLLLLVLSGLLGVFGIFPFYWWHIGVVLTLVIFTLLLAIYRFQLPPSKVRLFHPHHVREIALGIRPSSSSSHPATAAVSITCTSLGLNISSAGLVTPDGKITHYSISAEPGKGRSWTVNKKMAHSIAALIRLLRHRHQRYEIREGQQHIFHILFYEHPSTLGQPIL